MDRLLYSHDLYKILQSKITLSWLKAHKLSKEVKIATSFLVHTDDYYWSSKIVESDEHSKQKTKVCVAAGKKTSHCNS